MQRLRDLYVEHRRPVSVIGWSLGGLYARELAKQSPEQVRLVITLGSPFTGHPRETNAWRLYELASGHRIDSHDFHGPHARRAARADDLDLQSDGRYRRVAVQRRDASRAGGKHRRRIEPPRPRRASGGALCDRRSAGAAGRPLGAFPPRRVAAVRLLRPGEGSRLARGAAIASPSCGEPARACVTIGASLYI